MSKAVGFCIRALLTLALTVPLGSRSALAAGSADAGWYDPQSSGAPRAPATAPPAAPPAAAGPNLAEEPPSLPPSPLLDAGNAPAGAAPVSTEADRDPRALEDFRPQLDPYGTWMQHPTYGTVWVPSPKVVGSEFSPYVSAGRWSLDDQNNWVWVSDYPFGGVVFHYGRWVWISGTGWAWVPGYQYAPAWVNWRVPTSTTYAYVGWAPMGPDYVWYGGFAVSFWYGVYTPWIYCSSYYAFYPHVHYYVVRDPYTVAHCAANTRPYVPASGVGSHPTVQRSPSMAEARVPSAAIPRARLPSTVPPTSGAGVRASSFASRQFSSGGIRPAAARVPSGAQAARFRAPEPASRGAADPSRFRAQHTPVAPSSYTPPTATHRSSPTPRTPSFSPSSSAPRSSFSPSSTRSFSPSPSIPRSFSPSSTRSFSPSPSMPRSFSPGGGGALPRGRR